LLKRILGGLSINVIEASDVYEALQASKTLVPHQDVFFMDVLISPNETGLSILAGKETKFKWLKDINIIVVSGLGDMATIMKAMGLGADGYVIKPYSEGLIKKKLIEIGVL